MVRDTEKIMKLCRDGLPASAEDLEPYDYIPDVVHDFILDYWDELKELMSDE